VSALLRSLGEPVLWKHDIKPRISLRLLVVGYTSDPTVVRVDRSSEDEISVDAARSDTRDCPARFASPSIDRKRTELSPEQ